MASDIRLDEDIVVVEGHRLDVNAADIILDSSARHKQPGGYRRALVHGFNDELVINFGADGKRGDYPGGVTIQGSVQIPFKLSTDRIIAKNIKVDIVEHIPKGIIKGKDGMPARVDMISNRTQVDLGTVLKELRSQVADLEAKVAELEAKIKSS